MMRLALVTTVLLLSGCSQKAQDMSDTLTEAFYGFPDINMTKEEINQIPYASTYARINDGQQIFLVLGYVDTTPNGATHLKWISSDNAMIVTQDGRVVKTVNLPTTNLAQVEFLSSPKFNDKNNWQAVYDWTEANKYGFTANIETQFLDSDIISTPVWTKKTNVWREIVSYPELNDQAVENTFWVDEQQQVVKSIQFIGPDMTKLELTHLKFYGK